MAIVARIAYLRFARHFTIDGKRVCDQFGLVARDQQTVRLNELRTVGLRQGPVQRLIGTGNVVFYSSGSGGADVVFSSILQPKRLRDDVDEFIEKLE